MSLFLSLATFKDQLGFMYSLSKNSLEIVGKKKLARFLQCSKSVGLTSSSTHFATLTSISRACRDWTSENSWIACKTFAKLSWVVCLNALSLITLDNSSNESCVTSAAYFNPPNSMPMGIEMSLSGVFTEKGSMSDDETMEGDLAFSNGRADLHLNATAGTFGFLRLFGLAGVVGLDLVLLGVVGALAAAAEERVVTVGAGGDEACELGLQLVNPCPLYRIDRTHCERLDPSESIHCNSFVPSIFGERMRLVGCSNTSPSSFLFEAVFDRVCCEIFSRPCSILCFQLC